jgi:hypothetical protein
MGLNALKSLSFALVTIRGWYCLSTGRIHFVHRNLDSGDAVRVFTGNVSDKVTGQPLSMAGRSPC